MSHDQITIGPSDDSGPPNGVPNDGYRRNDQFPDDCQGVQICHAWDMNRDGGPGPQDGGPWNGDPGIWAQGPRDGRFNGDPGIWAEGPRDGRWNRDPGIWSDMPPGGPGQRFDGGSTDTAAVMKAASAVSQALQTGDLDAASQAAANIDPRSIRMAKMDLFGAMREARPEERMDLMRQGRELSTLQRASFAFELINRGEDREGILLLHQMLGRGGHGPRGGQRPEIVPASYEEGDDPGALPADANPNATVTDTGVTADPNATVTDTGVTADPNATVTDTGTGQATANPDANTAYRVDAQGHLVDTQNQPVTDSSGKALSVDDHGFIVDGQGAMVTDGAGNHFALDLAGKPIKIDAQGNRLPADGQPTTDATDAYDYSGDPTLNTGGDPSATNNGTVGDGTYNPTYEGDAGTGDGTTVTDATTSDTSTATSPFQAVVALGQQVRQAGQMTPELKQQFEAAIQQADSGQSPRLAGLQAEFSQKDQELNAALTQDVVTQISDINNQLMTGISQLPDQNQQAQGQALLSMLDSAVSAEDKAQIRGQLLQLLPNAGSLLDQRDQVTAPFQDKLFAISSLGQEIAAEQNQAVYTRVIYAQALAASGDATSASGIIDEALSKNTDQTMVGYLQQVKQSLSGTAAPTSDTTSGTVTDNTNVGPGSPDTGTPPDTGSVTVPDTGSVTPPDTGTGLGDTSGQNSDNPYDLGS